MYKFYQFIHSCINLTIDNEETGEHHQFRVTMSISDYEVKLYNNEIVYTICVNNEPTDYYISCGHYPGDEFITLGIYGYDDPYVSLIAIECYNTFNEFVTGIMGYLYTIIDNTDI